ncbi:MAG: YeeE/YedE family protein [Cytophagales bacterium]|nr:YeeE/YedE family protein [Cytophagales bacterium]
MSLNSYIPSLAGGILIGLASWLVLASLGRVTGISGIASTALFERPHADSYADAWRWFFLVGLIFGGALFAAWLHTPPAALRSPWLLIVAGLLVGFGTVIGSGCTSGHGVCGIGRRSVRSLLATCTFMAAGVLTVWIMK